MAKLSLPRWLAPTLVIVLIASVVGIGRFVQPTEAPAVPVACANPQAGCGATLDGRAVEVGMTGVLKVLSPIQIWARAPGARSVEASFTMEGMDMGFNLYTLRPDAQGVFRANVTLPVCVTGRRDWLMTIRIDGRALVVPFVTEL